MGRGDRRYAEGGCWIWFPEGDPAKAPSRGALFGAWSASRPTGKVVRATVIMTADDGFTLLSMVAGQPKRRAPNAVETEVAARLRPDQTRWLWPLTITGSTAKPAGLIGVLRVELEGGEPLVIPPTLSALREGEADDWRRADFDESQWLSKGAGLMDGTWESLERRSNGVCRRAICGTSSR